MSNHAKSVVGIDYDKKYIDTANKDLSNFKIYLFILRILLTPASSKHSIIKPSILFL